MRKFLLKLSICLSIFSIVVPSYSGSELDLEVTSQLTSELNQTAQDSEVQVAEVADTDSEVVVNSEVASENEIAADSEVVVDSEDQSQVVSSEESEVLDDGTSAAISDNSSTVKSQVQSVVTTAAGFTGNKDTRVNGTGTNTEYVNGKKTKESTYSNGVLTKRVWFYSNGKAKLQRTYYYDKSTKKYTKKNEYKFDTKGNKTDYTSYYSNGNLRSDNDYVEGSGLLIIRTYYYNSGQTKEVYKYNSKGVRNDLKAYFSNGNLYYDSDYNSKGIITKKTVYRSNKSKEFYRTYDSNGKIATSIKYNTDGTKYRYIEYYSNGQMKNRTYYQGNNSKKKYESWTSSGVRTRVDTWNSKLKKTDYKAYYNDGKLKANFDYYSNGKHKKKLYVYQNGKTMQEILYTSDGYKTSDKAYYSNGKMSTNIAYYDKGILKTIVNYNSLGKRTYYKANYANGKVKSETERYYTNGKPQLKYQYTYHSNGVIKQIKQMDYIASGGYSIITSNYNTSGRKTSENVSSNSALSYFKVPMKNGYITCQYECYDSHTGVDFGNTNKTVAVYSTAPGEVVLASDGCSANGGYLGNTCNYGAGNYVVIKHTYKGKQYFSLYQHLSAINVKKGQKVTTSTKIGNMGNSGNTSGPHLHFELFEDTDLDNLRSDEYRSNPAIFLDLSSEEIKIW